MVTLLFHAPCFDGLCSADTAKTGWLASAPVDGDFAAVDLLSHPRATFWADHHLTTSLDAGARAHFEARREAGDEVLWDPAADLGQPAHRRPLAQASRVTDAALYESAEEAVFGAASALRIDRSLPTATPAELVALADAPASSELSDVAQRHDVARRAEVADARARLDLERVRSALRVLDDGVLYLDWADDEPPSRYLVWLAHPAGTASVVWSPTSRGTKISAMTNPWSPPEALDLGRVLSLVGGGGHARVGSAFVPPDQAEESVRTVLERVASALR
jgi:hypothetical protein